MAAGSTAAPKVNDWVTVDPGDWQDASAALPKSPVVGHAQSDKPTGFFASAWDELKHGPLNLSAMGNAMLHPVDTFAGWAEQNGELAHKAIQSYHQGDYPGAFRAGVNYLLNAVPGLGASSQEAGDQFGRGDVAGGLGRTVGIGVNMVAGTKMPEAATGAAKVISNPAEAVRAPFRADPRIAAAKAFKPTPSDSGFTDRIPNTLEHIKEANAGVSPVTDEQVVRAAQRGIDRHEAALEPWMTRAQGVQISGQPILDATESAIRDSMLPSEAQKAQDIAARARMDYGGSFTPEQLKARLELLNGKLSGFYDKSVAKQIASLSDIPDAVIKAQRDAVADALYRALDPEGNGAGPRLIQSQIGDMIDLKNAALRRKNAIMQEQPVSPAGRIGDAAAAVMNLPGKFVTGDVGAGVEGLSKALRGTSNPLIKRAFDAVGRPNALPQPATEFYPSAQYPQRALGTGDIITPPPADTSAVTSTTGAPLRAPTTRQLPPPATRPPSELSGPSGDPLDLVPVRNAQGQTSYMPRPMTGDNLARRLGKAVWEGLGGPKLQ